MLSGRSHALANLRRGVVEHCILASLRSGDRHGSDVPPMPDHTEEPS